MLVLPTKSLRCSIWWKRWHNRKSLSLDHSKDPKIMIAAKGVNIKLSQLICLQSSPKSWLQLPHEFPKISTVATTRDPHNHPQSQLLQPHEIPKIMIAATTRDLQNHNYRSNHIISIKILKTNFKKQLNNPLSWTHWDAQFLHPWSFTYKIHQMVYVWYICQRETQSYWRITC